jgi:hypothetical protein
MSQDLVASPVLERAKRPHNDDELDSPKRMRFSPQQQSAPPSSSVKKNEITRITIWCPKPPHTTRSELREQKSTKPFTGELLGKQQIIEENQYK